METSNKFCQQFQMPVPEIINKQALEYICTNKRMTFKKYVVQVEIHDNV
jgi:hypothetical protein